jgi:hypothetical protein
MFQLLQLLLQLAAAAYATIMRLSLQDADLSQDLFLHAYAVRPP